MILSFQGENSQIDFGNNASSEFNLALEYTPTGGILNKTQKHIQDNNLNTENSYSNNYEYVENSHKVKRILNSENNLQIDFNYDANGNMTLATDNQNFANRHYWDEENRLRVVDQSNIMHHYIYDANGERVLKSSSNFIEVAENGTVIGTAVTFDNYTTYASPEIVVDNNNNYTKHYYNGSTRFLTRLGGNADLFAENAAEGRMPPSGTDDASSPDKNSISFDPDKLRELQISDLGYYFRKGEKKATPSFKEFKDNSVESNQDDQIDEDFYKDLFGEANFTTPEPFNQAEAFYYYHTDHLGSNELLTDFSGEPHEFHLTLPFGETMVEQRKIAANYYNSWKFTGKELDEETGFYYFGARYYQPKWSIWLSVDPLAEKYSSWSSYNYTMNNPINLIDPDGKRVCPPGVDCDNPLIELYYSIKETLEHSKRRRKKDKERMKSDIKKAKNKVGEGLSNLSSMLSKLEINLPGGLMLSKDKGAAQGDSELIREGGRISGDEENGEWVDISILLNGPFVPGKGVIMKGNKYNRMANKIDDVAEGSNRLREANEKRKDQQSKSDKIFKCKACSRIGRDSIYKVNNDGKIELNINQLVDPENTRSTH